MVVDCGHGELSTRRRGQTGRANEAHQAAQAGGRKVNICQNDTAGFVRMKTGGCDKALKTLERVKGIEPSYSAWKAAALPLSYTRARPINYHASEAASTAMHRFGV